MDTGTKGNECTVQVADLPRDFRSLSPAGGGISGEGVNSRILPLFDIHQQLVGESG
jgi:hypothetical protein